MRQILGGLRLGGVRLALGLAAASLLGIVTTAGAQITNGDFATGDFSGGYTPYGNVQVTNTSQLGEAATNTSGSQNEALLQTSSGAVGGGAGTPLSATALATDLGLPSTTFTGAGFYQGSALTLGFSSAAGNTLSFDYNFLTNEAAASPNQDQAFAYLSYNGGTPQLLALPPLTPATATTSTSALDFTFDTMTGYATFPVGALSLAGNYTLEFVVLNQDNQTPLDSGLLVDNIILSPNTGPASSVPLPAAVWAGLLGGLLALGFAARMRRQTSTI